MTEKETANRFAEVLMEALGKISIPSRPTIEAAGCLGLSPDEFAEKIHTNEFWEHWGRHLQQCKKCSILVAQAFIESCDHLSPGLNQDAMLQKIMQDLQ